MSQGIVANFKYLDHFCSALEKIRDHADFKGYDAFSPTSYHEIEEASGLGASPVRFCTLVGGLTGMICGFALCLFVEYDWPIVVGGKTPGIYSLPAFVIIGFELTILLGAFGTIFGMLFFGRLANPLAKVYEPKSTDNVFTIFVPGVEPSSPQASLLKSLGAQEIKIV